MSQFDRRSTILGDLDVRALKGLELGPLTNPVVRKTDGVVFYIDHLDAESLKKANRNPQIINDNMVDIDIIWGERPLKELVPYPMDYAVASHVMEHVPDFVGSLMDLHGALKEDGLICLAIPDRRFTHDLRRPESTVGEMVEAYLLRVRRPPARHLFDRVLLQAPRAIGNVEWKAQAWDDNMFAASPVRTECLPDAYRLAERAVSTTDYVDAHCWIFTPESFLDVADRLSRIGLFPFAIEYFHPTEYGDYEFYTRLRKSQDLGAITASIQEARQLLGAAPTEQAYREMLLEKVYARTLPEPSYGQALRELTEKRKQLQGEQHRLYHELACQRKHLESERRRLDADFRHVQGLLDEVKASTSWRLTRPLRWLGRVLRATALTRRFVYDPLHRQD